MKFSHTIFYVKDVLETVNFYKKAFGIDCKFVHESNHYAEMETGTTTLAFSQHELIKEHFHFVYQKAELQNPFGMQITFEPNNVDEAYKKALKAGAKIIKAPLDMPWRWRCAMVEDLNGFLVELAKPLN